MTKWEYKAVFWADVETKESLGGIGLDPHLDWISRELSKYGADGWELLNVNFDMDVLTGIWLFKREIGAS